MKIRHKIFQAWQNQLKNVYGAELKNGWVKMEGNIPGDQTRLGCNPGFMLAGAPLLGRQIAHKISTFRP